ncbi:hypothetical protein FXN61_15445 [Lentzea sp. PSKA42]|uniref:Uncharacterized protein n=1 Tax=Lentzea indica TaxID=2604800 RepID=A0ABX1FHB0_9PSEU|nr:hypothetical protein [Lentzea indica]NKE58144.1 hypothetical protein [Lentzea indica]
MSVVAHLLRIAGPDLYARSPFRIMWLETQADIDQADWRRLGILADIDLADWPRLGISADMRPQGNVVVGSDLWLPPPRVTRQLLDRAMYALKSSDERLAEELFWYWDEAHGCGCPFVVHLLHNEAVRAHATVLYLEGLWLLRGERREEVWRRKAARKAAWREAATKWRVALAHEGFWHHVRRRAGDAVDLDELRATLPRALLQPQAELAARRRDVDLLALLDEWDVGEDIRTEAIRRAATPRLERARVALAEIVLYRGAGPLPSGDEVGGLAKTLCFVEKALPDERSQRTAEIRSLVKDLCALCGIMVAATADTRDLCWALEDAARWLRAEEARRGEVWRAAQRSRVTPWSYRPDRTERLDRVQRMIAAGSFRSATRELEDWRANATTSSEREEIRRLLDEVERRRAQTEVQPETGPARRQAWAGWWKAVAAILIVLMLVLLVVLLLLPRRGSAGGYELPASGRRCQSIMDWRSGAAVGSDAPGAIMMNGDLDA